ncbi:MAG: DUF4011 domain-containing protein, partial [Terriglobales bacterium]
MSTESTAPATSATAAIDPARAALVQAALAGWRHKLTDFSRRNILLYFRAYRTGTVDFTATDPQCLAHLLSGQEAVDTRDLCATDDYKVLHLSLQVLVRRAQANLEEKGLDTLALALGSATWPSEDGGRPTDAPVLLAPMKLVPKGSSRFDLSRSGPLQINPVLERVLGSKFDIDIALDDLHDLAAADGDEGGFDIDQVFAQIRERTGGIAGFVLSARTILGNFAFQKMAMVKDLEDNAAQYTDSDLIAAIAGDANAPGSLGPKTGEIEKEDLDSIAPENEFLVLDADSSQTCAIANAARGEHVVIHGPPGTGKSQTIANLIATLAAQGKRVLFVAEKRAALEVVLHRLHQVGLGHLALDLHGANVSPAKALRQLSEALNQVRAAVPPTYEETHSRFQDRRRRLNDHVHRLNQTREPAGMSVLAMRGKLLRISATAHAETRWRGESLNRISRNVALEAQDWLHEASGLSPLILATSSSPWMGAVLSQGDAAADAVELV